MGDATLPATEKVVALSSAYDSQVKMSWSCFDLHHSVFLGPDQLRTCCKRFFVDEEMKGDVVLLDFKGQEHAEVSPVDILRAKKELYTEINKGNETDCGGCPFLEFKDWGRLNKLEVKHLSFEYHSVCNMKCVYCSPTYYGGARANYDVQGLVEELLKDGHLETCQSIVWGGGEPTVDKGFEPLIDLTIENLPAARQRVISNSVLHSSKVAALLEEGRATLITSVDAGTKETFELMRQNRLFKQVLRNLKRYASADPTAVTIKYIFTEQNNAIEEVSAFADKISEFDLCECSFQISYDFKSEQVDSASLQAMVVLYGLLISKGCQLVFIDELVRQRIRHIDESTLSALRALLKELNIEGAFADPEDYADVVIWGAGEQTKLLLQTSRFFNIVRPTYIVDNTPSKIGTRFMDCDIFHPERLRSDNTNVLISAVQNSGIIYRAFRNMGLDEQRLIKGLII